MSRVVFPCNQDWLFRRPHQPADTAPSCDESGFARITLPHTVCPVPLAGFDERVYQGVSSYRKRFRLPAELKGRRVFVDFEGAALASRVYCNGQPLGEYLGGFTPFSFELTEHLDWSGDNVLAVALDSRERPDIPPFGGVVDYLCFGGIYREAQIRVVDALFIENVLVKPRGIVAEPRRLEVEIALQNGGAAADDVEMIVAVSQRGAVIYEQRRAGCRIPAGESRRVVSFEDVAELALWTLEQPRLYEVEVRLSRAGRETDRYTTRFGFRECHFTPEGFRLNGRIIPLRGLNRHQSYPWLGYAMPARAQRRDAEILRHELKVNIVRTSHYPQSRHFLDRCDELGLLVFAEIPGWQHIGDRAWQELSCRYLREMIAADFNHPAIVLWGVRINESPDNDAFYRRTNAVAHELDDTRQTSGVRAWGHVDSTFLEDVFAHNDFDPVRLREPSHPCYLITEFAGHMYPTKHGDNVERITENTRRHAHTLSQALAHPGIAGAIGWCAFDYNTHGDFGSGDRVCHHGVCDIFRLPKASAAVYRAQCSPGEEVVLEPAFTWSIGDRPTGGGVGNALINSNCDMLKLYLGDEFVADLFPDRAQFPGLAHPPFRLDGKLDYVWGHEWRALRIDGYIKGVKRASRTLSERGVDADFVLRADSRELLGDGADCTRVWFMVTDEHGNARNFAVGAIQFEIDGPGELIGDNPFALVSGRGAVWVRAQRRKGLIELTARHPTLGARSVVIRVARVVEEALSAGPRKRSAKLEDLAAPGGRPTVERLRGRT
jgi:beta-galactosidase